LRQKLQFKGGTSEEQERTLDEITDHLPESFFESDDVLTVNIGHTGEEIAEIYNDVVNPNKCLDYALGLYRHESRTIYISQIYIDNPDYGRFEYDNTSLFKTTSYKLWEVFAHEYGHHLDHKSLGYTTEARAERRVDSLRIRYGLPRNAGYGKHILMGQFFWHFYYIKGK